MDSSEIVLQLVMDSWIMRVMHATTAGLVWDLFLFPLPLAYPHVVHMGSKIPTRTLEVGELRLGEVAPRSDHEIRMTKGCS